MDLKDLIYKLCSASGVTGEHDAAKLAAEELKKITNDVHIDNMGNVTGIIKGKTDYLIMLEAHIDEIGLLVTHVDSKGFIKAARSGGVDLRVLPDCKVLIHSKEAVTGIFCCMPPHLKKDGDDKYDDLDNIYIDTGLGEKAGELIAAGDRITFVQTPAELLNGQITAKALDDRAGCAALLYTANLLKEHGNLPCSVAISLTEQEELGSRGAKTAAFEVSPDEAVAVDVSFGNAPGVPEEKCGKLGDGPMLGVSPVLSRQIGKKLEDTAKEFNIPIQYEGMGGLTSTNADVISVTKSGVKCGLLSIPLKNMHTPVEVILLKDVENTAKLLAEYVLKGGVMNA